jgi:copper ion binding protein
MSEAKIRIKDMHCANCARTIENAVSKVEGVKNAKADYTKGMAEVEFDPSKTNVSKIMQAIKNAGYETQAG